MNPKLYKLIALFNTLNTTLSAIIIDQIIHLVKEYYLLLNNYIKGYKSKAYKYILYILLK